MPNIAQQDYIRIHINDVTEPTEAEKAEIRKYAKAGVILDCLIEEGNSTGASRVLSYSEPVIQFFSQVEVEIVGIDYSK